MQTLLEIGLGNAAMATGLALLAACAGRLVNRPALVHCLWLLVLLKLVTPPLAMVAVPWPHLAAVHAESQLSNVPLHHDENMESTAAEAPNPRAEAQASVPTIAPQAEDLSASLTGRLAWEMIGFSLWLVGSLLWWSIAGVRLYQFGKLLRHAEPALVNVQKQADELAGRLGLRRSPSVWFLPAAVSPMLWTLGRSPRLLLPVSLWQHLTGQQQQALLAHELAHLRRRDHWVRFLELLVLGLYWWHPVVWWARRELREAEEQCCDAWVVWALPSAAPAYASALVETVAFLSQARPALPLTASGIGHTLLLRRRLTMILRGTTPKALSAVGILIVGGLALALLPLRPTWARSEPPDSPEDHVPTARGAKVTSLGLPQELAAMQAQETVPAQEPSRARAPKDPRNRTPGPDPVIAEAQFEDGRRTQNRANQPAGLSEEIERAREELELLQVQREIKAALLKGAQVSLNRANRRLETAQQLVQRGNLSSTELENIKADLDAQQLQLQVREAELREMDIRVRQAQNRLARFESRHSQPSPRPEGQRTPVPVRMATPSGAKGDPARLHRAMAELEIARIEEDVARVNLTAMLKRGNPGVQEGSPAWEQYQGHVGKLKQELLQAVEKIAHLEEIIARSRANAEPVPARP